MLAKLFEHAALIPSHAVPHAVNVAHGQAPVRIVARAIFVAERAKISRNATARIRLGIELVQRCEAKVSASHASSQEFGTHPQHHLAVQHRQHPNT
jgi:hypothetical protein